MHEEGHIQNDATEVKKGQRMNRRMDAKRGDPDPFQKLFLMIEAISAI
jgi:hypothetical protein